MKNFYTLIYHLFIGLLFCCGLSTVGYAGGVVSKSMPEKVKSEPHFISNPIQKKKNKHHSNPSGADKITVNIPDKFYTPIPSPSSVGHIATCTTIRYNVCCTNSNTISAEARIRKTGSTNMTVTLRKGNLTAAKTADSGAYQKTQLAGNAGQYEVTVTKPNTNSICPGEFTAGVTCIINANSFYDPPVQAAPCQ